MNKSRKIAIPIIFCFIHLVSSCGSPPRMATPLEERVLQLTNVYPPIGGKMGSNGMVRLSFSKEIDADSVNQESIRLIQESDLNEPVTKVDTKEVYLLPSLPGSYEISPDKREVFFAPEGGFSEGKHYLFITSALRANDGSMFLNNRTLFFTYFYVEDEVGSAVSDGGYHTQDGNGGLSGWDGSGADSSGSGGGSGSGGSGGSGSGTGSGGGTGGDLEPTPPPPSFLYINEIFYDANGVDTNGDVFIELVGEAGGYIKGYHIALINGDDGKTYDTIPIDGDYYIGDDNLFVIADLDSAGMSKVKCADIFSNFDPQNGPDAVQLIDPKGTLVDAVAYGNISTRVADNGLPMLFGNPAPDAPAAMSISRKYGVDRVGDNSKDFVINKSPSPCSLDVTE